MKHLKNHLRILALIWTGFIIPHTSRAEDQPDTHANCTARHEAALVGMNGRLYLLGGRGIKPVEEYHPDTRTWRKLAMTPMEFHHFQAVVIDGKIALIGAMTGKYPHEIPIPNIWFFDPSENKWSKGPEIPETRRRGGAGVVVDGDLVYLVCGIQNGHWNGFIPWLDSFNTKTGEWKQLPDAPHARDHFQSALVNGKIINAGGRTTYAETKQTFNLTVPEVDAYDINAGTWSTYPAKIPTPRAGCMAASRDGKVIILGGESGSQAQAHNQIEAFTVADGTWATLPPMKQGRHGTGAVFIGDKLYLAAGCANRGGKPELNTLEVIDWPIPAIP